MQDNQYQKYNPTAALLDQCKRIAGVFHVENDAPAGIFRYTYTTIKPLMHKRLCDFNSCHSSLSRICASSQHAVNEAMNNLCQSSGLLSFQTPYHETTKVYPSLYSLCSLYTQYIHILSRNVYLTVYLYCVHNWNATDNSPTLD